MLVAFTLVAIITRTKIREAVAYTIIFVGASLSYGDSNETEEDDNNGKREPHFINLKVSFSDVGKVVVSECCGQLGDTARYGALSVIVWIKVKLSHAITSSGSEIRSTARSKFELGLHHHVL